MHCKTVLVFLFVLVAFVYISTYLYIQGSRTLKMTTTVSRLGEIGVRLLEYKQENGAFPEESLVVLDLEPHMVQDPFTGEPFLYRPRTDSEANAPIVEQVSSFRTRLWPFGEKRKYVLYTNGSIRNIASDDQHLYR